MASHGDESDTDDLYSEDYPEVKALGILVHDPTLEVNKPYSRPTNCLPKKRSAEFSTPSPAVEPQVDISQEYQRIIKIQNDRYEKFERRFRYLEYRFRASLDREITRREKWSQESAIQCCQGIQADFIEPMAAHHLLRLSRFPDLALRYLQNERKVACAMGYMKMQVQELLQVHGLSGDSGSGHNHYKVLQDLRCETYVKNQAIYEHLISAVLRHIKELILESTTVHKLPDERLTLFESHLVTLIINNNKSLLQDAAEVQQLELGFANHRFEGLPRWTGFPLLDDELIWLSNGRQFPSMENTADDSYGNVENDGYGDMPQLELDQRPRQREGWW